MEIDIILMDHSTVLGSTLETSNSMGLEWGQGTIFLIYSSSDSDVQVSNSGS